MKKIMQRFLCLVGAVLLGACGGGGGGGSTTNADSPNVNNNPTLASISGLQASNDATQVYYQFQYTGAQSVLRLYLDTDQTTATGYSLGGIGADYLIENGSLYRYAGANGGWGWSFVKSVTYSNANQTANWTVTLVDIGSPAVTGLIAQVESPLSSSAKTTHVMYAPSTALFANPERGLYRHQGNCDSAAFNLATLQHYRTNEATTLVMCIFYLESFKASPISQVALDFFQSQMQTVRAAGVKAIVRFAYTADPAGIDAAPAQVAAHLNQLAPYLQGNSDVIYVVQAGIVGAWGEWYYTQNYGDAGVISAGDWVNRKAVIDNLLLAVPADRMVQLRTPQYKRNLYTATALTDSEAFSGSAIARLGHHNDCFLARWNDQGTYIDPTTEYPYLESETKYVAMGGETCELNPPRSDCATALDELGRFHWSYLNADYNQAVVDGWNTGGCLDQVKQKLGYRFVLKYSSFPAAVTPGATYSMRLALENQGWAAPINGRIVELVLRNTVTGDLVRLPLTNDPRRWLPGQTIDLSQAITFPTNVPAGTYTLLANLADPAPTLRSRPEYALQLANTGVWEAATGFNLLFHTVTVAY
ncbi:MAG TPA: DUF4832 domain-containing protein [Burkholderiales bacterium]|nr:DUF4832 domain-containing protein [Burkholderiales bacterium]